METTNNCTSVICNREKHILKSEHSFSGKIIVGQWFVILILAIVGLLFGIGFFSLLFNK
jgi:hypothetical protein